MWIMCSTIRMSLAAHCSKMVNGYHKVGLAAVLSFCWMLLHLEAEQQLRIHTILKDTKYCIEAALTLKREKNSRGLLKNGEQVTIKPKTRVWRAVVADVKPESPPKPKKRTAVEKCATAMMVTSDVVLASFPAHEGDPVTEPSTIIPSTRTPVTTNHHHDAGHLHPCHTTKHHYAGHLHPLHN